MKDRPKTWLKPAMRIGFGLAGAFAFIMAVLPHAPQLPGNPNDKLVHAMTFFTLTLLAGHAWPRAGAARLLFCLAAFGALIELVQATGFVHRDSSLFDWLADLAAVLLGLVIIRIGQQKWGRDMGKHGSPGTPSARPARALSGSDLT